MATKLREFIKLTKPKQTLLLMVSMYGGYFGARGELSLANIILLGLVGWLAISGTTAMNMVIEHDIDYIMRRTRNRPLPSGRLSRGEATIFSIALFILGIILAYSVSKQLLLAVLLGYYFDILIYTNLVKRSTPLNVVLGGIAGAMPAAGGWGFAKGFFDAGAFIVASIVFAWIPMHIWFIAAYYDEDYKLAGIPMLPVVSPPDKTANYIIAGLVWMLLSVWALALYTGYGYITAVVSLITIGIAIRKTIDFKRRPSRMSALKLFKAASPLLGIVFLGISLEAYLNIL